jgi:glycine/D-amino acid oxidase-like deaminating enzyme/nitrite reductase/ring-hydroxylating ferredoxin subunit
MNRDGFCTSLWQAHGPDYVPANEWNKDERYDVLIVGGGITGVTSAMLLQQAGKKCILAEAHNIGFGTTGGTTAHLNTFYDTPYHTIISDFGKDNAALTAKAAKEVVAFIKQQVAEHSIEGFSEKKAYLFATNEQEDEALEKLMTSANEVGAEMKYTGTLPVPLPYTKVVETETQAQFHPARYLYGLAAAYERQGGVLLQHCRVMDISYKNETEFEATTNSGIIKATRVIYATHIPPGVNLLHFRCAPYRSYAMAVTLKDGAYPDALVYDMKDPYHYYRTQEVDGKKYLIAGGEDHKTGHEENTENSFRRLEAHIRKHFEVEEVAYKWSSQYFEPADGLPYIGHLPGNDAHVYVATGFGGNGMIYGTLSAIILCDIITKGESIYEKLFDPNRVKPVAGFTNFVKENTDVVAKMIGGMFSAEKLPDMLELAPGDAKVVKYEGQKLAVYKDENHRLHMVSPVCPHAKCAVAWNNAEHSWDCPCHGSRFSVDGEMWTGPSRKDLESFNK